jgi:hypothetical protein
MIQEIRNEGKRRWHRPHPSHRARCGGRLAALFEAFKGLLVLAIVAYMGRMCGIRRRLDARSRSRPDGPNTGLDIPALPGLSFR